MDGNLTATSGVTRLGGHSAPYAGSTPHNNAKNSRSHAGFVTRIALSE